MRDEIISRYSDGGAQGTVSGAVSGALSDTVSGGGDAIGGGMTGGADEAAGAMTDGSGDGFGIDSGNASSGAYGDSESASVSGLGIGSGAETAGGSEGGDMGGAAGYEEAMREVNERDRLRSLEEENVRLRREIEHMRGGIGGTVGNNIGGNIGTDGVGVSDGEGIGGDMRIPELDIDGLMYAGDGERTKMVAEYSKKLIELASKRATADMLGRVAPMIKQYDESAAQAEMNSALDELSGLDGWGDIRERSSEIKKLCARDEFSSMNPTQRLAVAALIDRGLRFSEKRVPDLNVQADEVLANPELMKLIAARTAAEVRRQNSGIPEHRAGGGLGNAVYSTAEKPKSFDAVREKYGLI